MNFRAVPGEFSGIPGASGMFQGFLEALRGGSGAFRKFPRGFKAVPSYFSDVPGDSWVFLGVSGTFKTFQGRFGGLWRHFRGFNDVLGGFRGVHKYLGTFRGVSRGIRGVPSSTFSKHYREL